MNTKLLGGWGEQKALEYLRNKKYTPVAMGVHSRFGEIDIIVSNKKYIVFVEVKLRKNDTFASGREHVTASKQNKLRTTAEIWLSENETRLQPRFDVIEIYAPDGVKTQSPVIEHIEDAF